MPSLEETLLQRQVPTGPAQPRPIADQTPPSTGKSVFEGGVDGLLGLLGVGPNTTANQVGQLGAAALPIMRVGGKIIKNVGGVWKILDDAEGTVAMNKMKQFEKPQTMTAPEDLSTVLPPTLAPNTPPPLSHGNYQQSGRMGGRATSQMNESMVAEVRKRAAAGAHWQDLAKEYGIRPNTMYGIVKGDTWGWVK